MTAKKANESETATRRGVRPEDNGQRPSEEYKRFESMMKRLVRTPKAEPDKARRKRG